MAVKIKVLKVEPHKKPELVEINNNLETLQKIVGGYIEVVWPFEDDVCLICNEEGKMIDLEPNRPIYEDGKIIDVIHGTFLLAGSCECEFDDIPDELVDKYVATFNETYTFFMPNGDKYKIWHDNDGYLEIYK